MFNKGREINSDNKSGTACKSPCKLYLPLPLKLPPPGNCSVVSGTRDLGWEVGWSGDTPEHVVEKVAQDKDESESEKEQEEEEDQSRVVRSPKSQVPSPMMFFDRHGAEPPGILVGIQRASQDSAPRGQSCTRPCPARRVLGSGRRAGSVPQKKKLQEMLESDED
ncbi:GL15825 [Drosophila persimilis]|uniref:GL15825 n=1 Tax=Drosophila persimilis TaxID=7234 RepID=B4H117_DROPE|nr:GL15825 [Drosophila persimilis]